MLDLKDRIRLVEDFPEPGIHFKDITTLLREPQSFRHAVDEMVRFGKERGANVVVGPEARGFVLGAPVAYAMEVGFVPIRKPGKLPAKTIGRQYELEYGKDGLEIHQDALTSGDRVLVVDDLLATGGTIRSCVELAEELGATIVGIVCLIELRSQRGRDRLGGYPVHAVLDYE